MQYQILRMEVVGCPPLRGIDGRPYIFEDPEAAAIYAKKLSKANGEKLCVKPIVDEKWRQREDYRYANGEYRYLPWALQRQTWWVSDQAYAVWKDHYPHASLEKPGWIAYTKSPEDGAKDKQSLLRPGAYLNKYFEKVLNDYGMNEKALVNQFNTMYGPIDIKFAATAKDIVKVYNQGPQTCIHRDKCWPRDTHPASIYAAGDLQVAYIGDIDGKVSGRVLVWPEKKLHSRVYGDIARLTQGLQRLGYKWGAPIGAKLKRIQLHKMPAKLDGCDIPQGCFLVPYLDKKNQQGGGHLGVKDMGDHLIITKDGEPGSHHAGLPDGYTGNYVPREDEFPHFTCQRCEEARRELCNVYVQVEAEEEDAIIEQWCPDCANEYANRCNWSGEYYGEDVEMIQVDGAWWAKRYADMYAIKCEGTGKLFHQNNVKIVFFPDGTAKKLSHIYVEKQGGIFQSGLTSRYFLREDRATYYSSYGERRHCAKSELKVHAFQCDGCDQYWTLPYRNQAFGDDRLYCPNCFGKITGLEKTPVSTSRKIFEEERKQGALRLEAAE